MYIYMHKYMCSNGNSNLIRQDSSGGLGDGVNAWWRLYETFRRPLGMRCENGSFFCRKICVLMFCNYICMYIYIILILLYLGNSISHTHIYIYIYT